MVEISEKRDCCGCEACVQKCPKRCIKLNEDEEGFLYPNVDTNICIECGLCEKVCPVINQEHERLPLETYAAKNIDEEIIRNSSSGGVFSAVAAKVISNNGIVFGASFNNQWEVVHTCSETYEGCAKFRGSKYVQSRIGNSYIEVESYLKEGRQVLFSGTPCQVAGLKLYLKKDYENLLLIDFICHGVPSPGMFRWYLLEEIQKVAQMGDGKNSVSFRPIHSIPKRNVLESVENVEIEGISFRDKTKGWKKFSFALDLAKATADGEKNTVLLSYTLDKNPFLKGFLRDLYLRPSCYHCPTKNLKSGSDITIADYWGINKVMPELDDDKGINAVIINTEKGRLFFKDIEVEKVLSSFEDIQKYNAAICRSSSLPSNRSKVFSGSDGFIDRVDRLTKPGLVERLKMIIKFVIRRK